MKKQMLRIRLNLFNLILIMLLNKIFVVVYALGVFYYVEKPVGMFSKRCAAEAVLGACVQYFVGRMRIVQVISLLVFVVCSKENEFGRISNCSMYRFQ